MKTQRLEIKAFSREDDRALAGLLLQEEIKKTYMIPDFATPQTLEKTVERFRDLSLSENHFVRGIYLKGRLIGFVNDVERKDGCMELGYALHPDFWGRGYATEMLRAVIGALLGTRVTAIRTGAFQENVASLRVMEKCGMVKSPETEVIEYRGLSHTCVYYEIR